MLLEIKFGGSRTIHERKMQHVGQLALFFDPLEKPVLAEKAKYVGTHTCAHTLGKLREEGLINVQGQLGIHSKTCFKNLKKKKKMSRTVNVALAEEEHLPGMSKTLGLIPSISKEQKTKQIKP